MKVLALVVSLVVLVQGNNVEKIKRCKKKTDDFNNCTRKAHEKYAKAINAGTDGRPDFQARKSCNYLTDAVEECGNNLVGECNTEKEVTEMKDGQIVQILKILESSVKAWDSNKCPPVKAHIDRLKAAEEPNPEPSGQPEQEGSGEGSEKGGVGQLTPCLLLGLLLLL